MFPALVAEKAKMSYMHDRYLRWVQADQDAWETFVWIKKWKNPRWCK